MRHFVSLIAQSIRSKRLVEHGRAFEAIRAAQELSLLLRRHFQFAYLDEQDIEQYRQDHVNMLLKPCLAVPAAQG